MPLDKFYNDIVETIISVHHSFFKSTYSMTKARLHTYYHLEPYHVIEAFFEFDHFSLYFINRGQITNTFLNSTAYIEHGLLIRWDIETRSALWP